MAEINLRDYLARLESLVNSGEYTQVVHHCRHILQFFPRHADTYRLLGRALLDNNKWQEAAEVFSRLQSVNPSDYTAHVSLAEITNQLKRPDEAIWHLERAFEQQPNNQALIDNLRDLYRRHRKQEFNRVQLTAGAAARQYIRNGLYEQAIRVLQDALQQTPERVDLRLLLAQAYREAGYYVEAGETSLDVLQTLPDCLDANLILAELWLSLQRPSDAQRYLERVQAVDPYAALQMVEAEDVSADAFRLPELDFRRSVEREVLSGTPDWLEKAAEPEPYPRVPTNDLPGWASFTPASGAQTDDLQLDSAFRQELPADWMQTGELPSSGPLPPVEPPKRSGGLTGGLLSRFRTGGLPGTGEVRGSGQLPPMDEEEAAYFEPAPILPPVPPPRNKPPTQEVPVVQARFANPDETKRFDESLMDPLGAPTSDEIETPTFDENDPLFWMKASNIDIEEPIDPRRTTASVGINEENVLAASDSDDPMAWMQDYGTGILAEEAGPARLNRQQVLDDDSPVGVSAEEADPLAWLRGSGVEVIEDAPERPLAAMADPLDWLSDDEALLNEALDVEAMVTNTPPPAAFTAPQPTASIDRQDAMPQSPDNDLDWLRSQDEPEPENFDWSATEIPTEAPPPSKRATGLLNRFRTGNIPGTSPVNEEPDQQLTSRDRTPDFLKDVMPTPEPVSEAGNTGWLDDMMTSEPQAQEPGGFDWSAAPEQPAGTGWLDDMMIAEQPGPVADDVPEWLGGMNIAPPEKTATGWFESAEPEEAELPIEPKRSTGLLNRFRTGNLPGTNQLSDETTEPQPASTPATGWLDDMMTSEPDGANEESNWLMDTGPLSASSVRATDELGWGQPSEAAPATGWLDDMMTSEPSSANQEAAWLMDTGPLSASPAEPAMDDFAWAKSTQDIAPVTGWLDSMMSDEQPAEEVPDWSSQASSPQGTGAATGWFESAEPEEPPTTESVRTTGLLSRFRTGNLPATGEVGTAGTGDWSQDQSMAEQGGWDADEFAGEQTAPQDDVPAWLAQTGALMGQTAAPQAQEDVPEWLAQTGDLMGSAPAAQQDFEWNLEEPAAPEAAPVSGWMDEIQPDAAATADWSEPAAETGEWADDPYADQPAAEMRTTGLLNRFQTGQLPITGDLENDYPEAEPELEPDWLSAVVPGAGSNVPQDASAEDDISAWMAQTGSLLEEAATGQTNPFAEADEEIVPDQSSMRTTGLLNRFKTGNLPATGSFDTDTNDIDFGWSDDAQAAPVASSDAPDWLKNLDTGEVEAVVEPDIMPKPGTGPIDQIDWGTPAEASADYYEEEPVQDADAPDWLASMEPAEPEPEVAAPRAGTTPLDQINWGTPAEASADYYEEEPVQYADAPDWLASMEPAEPEPEVATPRAGTTPLDQINWGTPAEVSADYYEEEPVQDADAPDWLASMEPAEPEPEVATPRAGTTPLDQINWGTPVEASADYYEEEPVQEAETPDWLAGMEPAEPELEVAAPVASADQIDWGVQAEASAEADYVEEESFQESETPEWLAEMEPAEPQAVAPLASTDQIDWDALAEPEPSMEFVEEAPEQQADMGEWLGQAESIDLEPAAGQPIASEDDLSWMRSAVLDDAPEPEMAIAASEEIDWEAATETAEPAWIEEAPANDEGIEEAATWAAAPIAAGAAAVIASSQPGPTDDGREWEEELETSPALNAPDWLNDMVPGLDISYDAEEDTVTEEGFAPAVNVNPGTLRPKVDYAWLMDIADEESRYMLPVTDTVLARKRRYIFTREPVWLRRPTEERDVAAATAENDIDLPPWLQ
jgi:tetratricopeptide (TPR) repeat protein